MRRIRVLVVVAVLTAALAPPGAGATSLRPRNPQARGPWLVLDDGRVLIVHGVNVVDKRPPYVPSRAEFNEADARLIRSLGLNVVRLGFIWKAFEPTRGRFDYGYVSRIYDIASMLGRYGIYTLLDFHQDVWNEKYGGEGAPDWAVIDDGAWTGAEPLVLSGWASRYLTPGLGRAFDNFWENTDGIQDEYVEAWARVAQWFKDADWLLGYDLMNEPWPGTEWPAFQTDLFESTRLQPFYEAAIHAIRAWDGSKTIWYEPSVTNDFGAANGLGSAKPLHDERVGSLPDNLGMSFHVYCIAGETVSPGADNNSPPCQALEDRAWQEQTTAHERNDHAWLLSEFGATDDLIDVGSRAAQADDHLVGWAYWSWKYYDDPTGAADEGLVMSDTGRPALKEGKADLLSRTYARAIAGIPTDMSFDPESGAFGLRYDARRMRAPTEVYVPVARHYPHGYTVKVTGPARVISGPNAAILRLRSTGAGAVTVVLTRR